MDCAFATATSAAPSALYELADDHEQLLEHAMLPSAGAAFEALAFEPAGLLVPAALLHQHQHQQPGMDVQHLSPSSTASSSLSSAQCRCVIDLSTPATLERDFYAWLQGNDMGLSRGASCTFSSPPVGDLDLLESSSPGTSHCSEASSSAAHNEHVLMTAAAAQKPRARRKRNVDKGRGTNLYGRPYCPGRPLSMDERCQIIQLFQAGMKVNAISKQLCISHGCVSKIITRFRETGLLIPSSHAECRRRKRMQLEAAVEQLPAAPGLPPQSL